MSEQKIAFSESVPIDYDRYLGPMFFEPYAEDLAKRLQVREGMRVLEIACGTGIVTRKLREQLPPAAQLTATDVSEAMLARARRSCAADAAVEWAIADATALPFSDKSFDAVVCQFGLMFMPDKAAAFREARRVLTVGGQFLFNVWDSLAENDFAAIAHETARSFFEDDRPDFYATPFGFSDGALIERLLIEAGFSTHAVRKVDLRCVSPSADDAARGLIFGSPLLIQITERGGDPEAVTNATAHALAARFGAQPVRGRMRALVGIATR